MRYYSASKGFSSLCEVYPYRGSVFPQEIGDLETSLEFAQKKLRFLFAVGSPQLFQVKEDLPEETFSELRFIFFGGESNSLIFPFKRDDHRRGSKPHPVENPPISEKTPPYPDF